MKKKYIWIGVAVVMIAGIMGGVMFTRGGEEVPEVQTATVERQKIVQKVNANGRIQPRTQVKISADLSAKITKLAVEEGQWVEKGEFLIELDRERHVASVESAEASVRSAGSEANLVAENMKRAEKEFTRSQELKSKNLESEAQFDALQAAYLVEKARFDSANDRVEQAKAALKQARDDLSKTTIYAPMSGTVSDLNKEQGEIAIGSQFQEDVILIIADLAEMEAQVNVDENDIVSVAIGQDAEIEVDALLGQTLKGVVSEIANSANVQGEGGASQKTEFEVKIRIIDPGETLRPGMTASVDILTKTNEDALSVPIQSVALRTADQLEIVGEGGEEVPGYEPDQDGFVEIVFSVEDGKAVAKQVKTGIQSDDLIEILEGLEVGEEIVTGSYRAISRDLQNGGEVIVNNDAPASEAT